MQPHQIAQLAAESAAAANKLSQQNANALELQREAEFEQRLKEAREAWEQAQVTKDQAHKEREHEKELHSKRQIAVLQDVIQKQQLEINGYKERQEDAHQAQQRIHELELVLTDTEGRMEELLLERAYVANMTDTISRLNDELEEVS